MKTGLIFTQLERHSRKMNRKVRLQRSKLLLLADNKTVFEQLRVIQSRYSAWRTDHAHRNPGVAVGYAHAMMFPYRFFMRFSSFLAESHGADCPSKKL